MSELPLSVRDFFGIQLATNENRKRHRVIGEWDLSPSSNVSMPIRSTSFTVNDLLECIPWYDVSESRRRQHDRSISDLLQTPLDFGTRFFWAGELTTFRNSASLVAVENLDQSVFFELRLFVNVFSPVVRAIYQDVWRYYENKNTYLKNIQLLATGFLQLSALGLQVNAVGSDEIDGISDSGFLPTCSLR